RVAGLRDEIGAAEDPGEEHRGVALEAFCHRGCGILAPHARSSSSLITGLITQSGAWVDFSISSTTFSAAGFAGSFGGAGAFGDSCASAGADSAINTASMRIPMRASLQVRDRCDLH